MGVMFTGDLGAAASIRCSRASVLDLAVRGEHHVNRLPAHLPREPDLSTPGWGPRVALLSRVTGSKPRVTATGAAFQAFAFVNRGGG